LDTDDEAASLWIEEAGMSPDRIVRRGKFDQFGELGNFWWMHVAGPCGPCSEIFYDHGDHIPGGPPGSAEASAEDEAMQSIGRQSMLELIEDLSVEQQQVLTLKMVFNFTNADVATILDKTEGAIKSLQHRALVSLQKQIAKK
jgi:RNA polymerase sigma factor (sigma-70 family)